MSLRFELPEGETFGTICADPPWPLGGPENTKRYPMGHRTKYDRMALADICAIPVGDIVHPDGHLWLWTTNPALEMALDVVASWGFRYTTMATWRKSKLGLGWWLRSRTEHLIFAVRSTAKRVSPGSYSTEIVAPYRGEAVKPMKEVAPMIEALSPGPYLELFAGEGEREGWTRLRSHDIPTEAFNQDHILKVGTPNMPDRNDGVIRGVGGLEIHANKNYYYLEKAIMPLEVTVLAQTNRKVQILVPGQNGDPDKKRWVSIDNLRGTDWAEERTGQRKVVWQNA